MKPVTEICTFRTSDNERLHGALLTPAERPSELALLFVHGVAMNFYLPPLFNFGTLLAERGYHSFVINTRGHDWISRAGNLTQFGGSAYEMLENCVQDLDGALEFLAGRGYRRFVLVGHSLGAIKSILYQGTLKRPDILGVVCCSAPKQFYSERVARQPEYRKIIDEAEALVAAGRGEELMSVGVGATPGIFTARTHINKYGRGDGNDCRPHAKNLPCPLLVIVGGAEAIMFHEYGKEIAAGAGARGSIAVVDGANHFYNRHTPEMVEVIAGWLCRLED